MIFKQLVQYLIGILAMPVRLMLEIIPRAEDKSRKQLFCL